MTAPHLHPKSGIAVASLSNFGRNLYSLGVSNTQHLGHLGKDNVITMTHPSFRLVVILGLCGVLTACNTSRFGYGTAAAPLEAQPVAPVRSEPLQPPPGSVVTDDGTAQTTDVAALQAPDSAVAVTVGDLAGGWNLTSEGETCNLVTSQTTWTGGYRASTRGCNSPTLSSIAAWKVNGQQIQLFDGEGKQLASLFGASKTEFNGQTRTGQPISFSR